MFVEDRKELILRLIIEDYIQTAEPVGSKQLADRHGLDFSSATIRNEMVLLEQEGYLRQPHTSAGRIPTEKAYLYYLQNVVEPKKRSPSTQDFHAERGLHETEQETLRIFAKRLVEISGETALVAFDPRSSYYVGVSNLLQKPDFDDVELIRTISLLVDQFDEVMSRVYDRVQNDPVVYIGSQNPFGNPMATILIRYHFSEAHEGLLGLVGPVRMDYAKNIALLERAQELIAQIYD